MDSISLTHMHTLYTCMHKHTRMWWIGILEMKQWKLVHPLEMNSPNPRYVSNIWLIIIAKAINIIFSLSMFSVIKGIAITLRKGWEYRMCSYRPCNNNNNVFREYNVTSHFVHVNSQGTRYLFWKFYMYYSS